MATQDFLAEKRAEIERRKAELLPLVEEYNRLEQAAAALDAVGVAGNGSSTPQRASQRVKAATRKPATGGTRGRPKGSGKRDAEVAEIVAANPDGITIQEIANRIGIKPNYLYRVLPALEAQGKVAKGSDKRWLPVKPTA
jgi:hypothetical protein